MDTLYVGTRRVSGAENGGDVEFPLKKLHNRSIQILGQAGSGKTVMGKVILEECALAGIPSIILDVQGDLAQMAMAPEDDPLADPERQKMWSEKVEPRVWTPLTDNGLQICINPFQIPGESHDTPMDDSGDLETSQWRMMAVGLGKLLGMDESDRKGKQAISFLEIHMKELGADGEAPRDFAELAESLRALEDEDRASRVTKSMIADLARTAESYDTPSETALFTKGSPLDIGMMLQERVEGKTPVNILYLNTLRTKEKQQIFIQQFCRQLWQWLQDNAKSELQCVLFLDEAREFLPSGQSNPPSKPGIKLMLHEGRKYGLGTIIATQAPTDVDYKAMGQCQSAFIGMLRQDRSKDKVKNLLETAPNSEGIIESLPTLDAGEFELFSPKAFPGEVVSMKSRWLLTPHGKPLQSKDLRALTPDPLRKWATGFIPDPSRRRKVPSWRKRKPDDPIEVMHGLSTLGSSDDPMEVMRNTTKTLAFATLLVTTAFLGQSYIDEELNAAWLAIGGLICVLLSVLLAMDLVLQGQTELGARVRRRDREFEWVVLAWIWTMWAIDLLDWIDLGWAYYAVMASQTLLTVFVVLEYAHGLRLARTILGGESLLDRVMSVGAALSEAEKERAMSSSDELMRWFGLLTTTLTVVLISTLLWTGSDLTSGLLRELGVRLVTLEGSVLISSLIAIRARG